MANGPLVSIVTPSLNQGRFIGATVESVLRQSYPSIEYVVLDAGSTDETHDVLRSFGDRVQWQVAPDKGQSDAINKGWKAAKGSIVAWLCADDLLEPDAVATAVRAFDERPTAGAVYGDVVEFYDDGTEHKAILVAPFHLWRLINVFDFIGQPAAFFRRDAVEAAGWLDPDLHYAMDWDLFIRLGLRHPMVYVPETLARARIHDAAKTQTGGRRRFRELTRVIRRYADTRRPPAYWFYGLGDIKERLDAAIDRRLSKVPPLRRGAKATVQKGRNFVAKRTFMAVDDWFPDGWAGPGVRYIVPSGSTELTGSIPEDMAPQTLAVVVADKTVWSRTLDAGAFRIIFDAAPTRADGACDFTVTATNWKVIPRPFGATRRVAYRLDTLDPS